MEKRKTWQARQKFVRAVKKARMIELNSVKANEFTLARMRKDIRYYGSLSLEIQQSYVDNDKAAVRICDWLLNCGLHPHYVGESISFCPKGRKRRIESHRLSTSLQRFITRRMPDFEGIREEIVNRLEVKISSHAMETGFRILRGEDLLTAYRLHIGGTSCMTGPDRTYKLSIYAENPETVGLAIMWQGDKSLSLDEIAALDHHCRTLVWQDGKNFFIDRVYSAGKFSNIAKNTLEESFATECQKQIGLDESCSRFQVEMTAPKNGAWPYLDNLNYCSVKPKDGKYTLSTYDESGLVEHQTQDGSAPGADCICENCNQTYSEDETSPIDDMCSKCFHEMHSCCEHCSEYVENSNTTTVNVRSHRGRVATETWCDDCVNGDATRCEHCEEYTDDDEIGDVSVADSRGRTSDEKWCQWCRDDEATICQSCDAECCNDMIEEIGGEHYCPDCIDEIKAEAEAEAAAEAEERETEIHSPAFVFNLLTV